MLWTTSSVNMSLNPFLYRGPKYYQKLKFSSQTTVHNHLLLNSWHESLNLHIQEGSPSMIDNNATSKQCEKQLFSLTLKENI